MFERALYGEDRYRALNLLRGFIFYLTVKWQPVISIVLKSKDALCLCVIISLYK